MARRQLLLCLLLCAMSVTPVPSPGYKGRRMPRWMPQLPIGFNPCMKRAEKPHCAYCDEAHLRQALAWCLPLQFAQLDNTTQGLYIQYTPALEHSFGLGNHLAQYFHSLGLAIVANIGFNVTKPFNVSGFTLPLGFPPNRTQVSVRGRGHCPYPHPGGQWSPGC